MIIGSTKDLDTIKRLIVWLQPNLNLHKPKGNPIMLNSFFSSNLLAEFPFNSPNTAREPASYRTTPSSSPLKPWSTGVHPSIPRNPRFLPGLQTGDNEGFESPQYTEQFLDSVTAALAHFTALLESLHGPEPITDKEKIHRQLWGFFKKPNEGQSAAEKLIESATNLGLEIPEIATKAIAAFSTPPEFQNYR